MLCLKPKVIFIYCVLHVQGVFTTRYYIFITVVLFFNTFHALFTLFHTFSHSIHCFVLFPGGSPGPQGSALRKSSESSWEEEVGEGGRRLEKVEEGRRRSEKIGEGSRRFGESARRLEKV